MRHCIAVAFFLLLVSIVQGQHIQKGAYFVSTSIGFLQPTTRTEDLNNHPFMFNVKSSYFIRQSIALGIEMQSTTYTEPESGVSELQQPGNTYTQAGIITDKFISVGVVGDLYNNLGRKFFLITGLFAHYLHNSFVDKGQYYSNGVPAGINYIKGKDLGYYAHLGGNLALCYFSKPNLSFTLRFAEFNLRLRRNEKEYFLASPLLIGIQYHFNHKNRQL